MVLDGFFALTVTKPASKYLFFLNDAGGPAIFTQLRLEKRGVTGRLAR
jgi:hypothetical protein